MNPSPKMFENEVVVLTLTRHNGDMNIFIAVYAIASVTMILWAR